MFKLNENPGKQGKPGQPGKSGENSGNFFRYSIQ